MILVGSRSLFDVVSMRSTKIWRAMVVTGARLLNISSLYKAPPPRIIGIASGGGRSSQN